MFVCLRRRYFLYPENEEPVWGRFKSDHATALEQLKKARMHRNR